MDTAAELRPGDEGFDGFRMRLSEDCVEYMLFVLGDKTAAGVPSLETVRKAADQKLSELASDYIWQRDPFKLETRVQQGLGLAYLYGITHYGDNVEDEWFIVYLLHELSKLFPNLWIRVSDSDGEFLLVEAAKVTPRWLSPENDAHRVWINNGKLLIIPLSTTTTTTTTTTSNPPPSKPLTLPEAITTLKTTLPTPAPSLIHSPLLEAEAFYRLEKYPSHLTTGALHHALATLPRKLAYLLHARPQAVAPATEAFYLRDPRAMKGLLLPTVTTTKKDEGGEEGEARELIFPPDDLVTVSVRLTRVLYAQLVSQRLEPVPAGWRGVLQAAGAGADGGSPAGDDAAGKEKKGGQEENEGEEEDEEKERRRKTLARLDLGAKLTTGFELLLAPGAHASASRVVREVGLLLEDLEEDGGDGALPGDEEIARWEGVEREDDDAWMDIDYGDFERELDGKEKGAARPAGGGFGDAAAQADLQKIVSRFEAFLNDESAGLEGAEIDEMDRDDDEDDDEEDSESDEDEDKDVSFDEEQFSRMMREMMGMPAEDTTPKEKGKQRVVEEEESEEDENEEEEIRRLMQQMESELKGHGALDLDAKPKTAPSIKAKGEGSSSKAAAAGPEQDAEEDEDEEVDIDYNLAKNLLESFKSQAGMAGPTGNLLGLMGMGLPRDEEDSDGEK